jgi:hypothetical protein
VDRSSLARKSARPWSELVGSTLSTPGKPLDIAPRQRAEARFNHDFSRVRIHADQRASESAAALGALAYTHNNDIAFGAGLYPPRNPHTEKLLMHELTHVVQEAQGRGGGDATTLEAEAGGSSTTKESAHAPSSFRFGGRTVHREKASPPSPELEFSMILSLNPISDSDAKDALDAYKKMPPATRRVRLESAFKDGTLAKLLRAVPKEAAINTYPDELREMLRFVEEASARAESGMSDDQMADAQAKFETAEAKKKAAEDAAAKAPKDKPPPPPTAADVEKARQDRVAKTSIPPVKTANWDSMDKATQADWTKRAAAASAAVVALAGKDHPELKLTAANFQADFAAIEKRGAGVLAFATGSAANPVAVFGYDFVRAAEADPGYVLGTVVHEIFGHREFGTYGSEYDLKVFDQAQSKIPGYTKPAEGTTARSTEVDAFAYQETEIYALLRSLPYSKSMAAKDAGKGLVGYEPAAWAKARIAIIKSQWEPKVGIALVRGLYQRLLLDPRISGAAIDVFRDGVRAAFTAAGEADEILK